MESIFDILDEKIFTGQHMVDFKEFPGDLDEFIDANEILRDDIMPFWILNVCCHITGAKLSHALSSRRTRPAVFARFLTMYFLRTIWGKATSYRHIGSLLGGKGHADVIHGIKIVQNIEFQEHKDMFKVWFLRAKSKVYDKYSPIYTPNFDTETVEETTKKGKQAIRDQAQTEAH